MQHSGQPSWDALQNQSWEPSVAQAAAWWCTATSQKPAAQDPHAQLNSALGGLIPGIRWQSTCLPHQPSPTPRTPCTSATQDMAANVEAPDQSHAYVASLYEQLRKVVSGAAPHADHFLAPCSAPDYRTFVPLDRDMHLQRTLAKTRSGGCSSVTQFIQDFEFVPRTQRSSSKSASSELTKWAAELQQACLSELQRCSMLRPAPCASCDDRSKGHQMDSAPAMKERCPTHVSLDGDTNSMPEDNNPLQTDDTSLQGSDSSNQDRGSGPSSDAQHPAPSFEHHNSLSQDHTFLGYQPKQDQDDQPMQRRMQQQQQQHPRSCHGHDSSEQDEEGDEDPEEIMRGLKAPSAHASHPVKRRHIMGNSYDGTHTISTIAMPAARSFSLAQPFPHSRPSGGAALTSLEALVAACELAAEKEGLDDDCHYYEELVAESPAFGRAAAAVPPIPSFPMEVPVSLPTPTTIPHAPQAHALHPRTASREHHNHRESEREAPETDPTVYLPPLQSNPWATANGATSGAFDVASAPKYRRHKSKVFIRPNKVVYLPTTFMEEAFDPATLPINCEMVVEADGSMVQNEKHFVTIKAVPRQGLSTMYCMTNVMKFQQQYLNWQILNWTKIDDHHIKIHLQGPNSGPGTNMARTSSVPIPRSTALVRTGSGSGTLPDEIMGRSNSSEPVEGDAPRSLSSNGIGTDCDVTPRSGAAGSGSGDVVRRSARSVRLTSQMMEHLQQERQVHVDKSSKGHHAARSGGHAGNGNVGSSSPRGAGSGGSPMSPGTAASHKRRSEFGPDTVERATAQVKQDILPPLSTNMHYPGRQIHHYPYQQGPNCNSANNPSLGAFVFSGATTNCSYMEGSSTANLYYMPAQGTSSRTINDQQVTSPRGHGSVRHSNGGVPPTRVSNGGPRCVVTSGTPNPVPASMAMGIPRLPGALAIFGTPTTAGPLPMEACGRVGMLGPSMPCRTTPSPPPLPQGNGSQGGIAEECGPRNNNSGHLGGIWSHIKTNNAADAQPSSAESAMDTTTAADPLHDVAPVPASQPQTASEPGSSVLPPIAPLEMPTSPFKRCKIEAFDAKDIHMSDGGAGDKGTSLDSRVSAPVAVRPQLAVPPPRADINPKASALRAYGSTPITGLPSTSPPLMIGGSAGDRSANALLFSCLQSGIPLSLQPQYLSVMGLGASPALNMQQALGMLSCGVSPMYTTSSPELHANSIMAAAGAGASGRASMPDMGAFAKGGPRRV